MGIVYYPCWFNVKVNESWIEGPMHILFQLDCPKSKRKKVLDIMMLTVRRSAWYAHSEATLQTLLCSKVQKERIERRRESWPSGEKETQTLSWETTL